MDFSSRLIRLDCVLERLFWWLVIGKVEFGEGVSEIGEEKLIERFE